MKGLDLILSYRRNPKNRFWLDLHCSIAYMVGKIILELSKDTLGYSKARIHQYLGSALRKSLLNLSHDKNH